MDTQKDRVVALQVKTISELLPPPPPAEGRANQKAYPASELDWYQPKRFPK